VIKSKSTNGMASVTFILDPAVGGGRAVVCGDWNDWSPDRDAMSPAPEGGFTLTLELPAGPRYRFRYLVDGERWENDWSADDYLPNSFGTEDSVIDLTVASGGAVQPAQTAKKAPAKRAPAVKKTAAAKKAAPVKKAAPAKKAAKTPPE